jgi:predicted YcjX-like family ATPase
MSGARVEVLAMAAVRATREGTVKQGREILPIIMGTPLEGETIGGERFDGVRETAIFPGDLPERAASVFEGQAAGITDTAVRFVRFRPPSIERSEDGLTLSLPHIRLDRAIQFLIGDHLA